MNTLNVVESVFLAALERSTPELRAAYLDEACRGDANLRRCVDRLLNAHPKAEGMFKVPAVGMPATVDEPAPITEKPGTVIGPYKLLQQLGEGGFGVVFLAEQEKPVRRKVALKIIKPGMDSKQVIARFEGERQALAMMDHPNIARVLDAGTTDSGRPYFIMELVKGVPLTEFCDQNRLTPRERLELFVPVCQAVQHAHQKGIIHRDLKPSNVLVTMYDEKPVAKVIDFGVAKAIEQKLTEQTLFTRVGQVIGTLEYMSPEQASLNALDVDTRSDVYALGVILYELLTGTTPLGKEQLESAGFVEMLRLIREMEPPKPSTRLSQSADGLTYHAAYRKTDSQRLLKMVRGELDWIAMRALEKDRSRRYPTASALAADVQRYLNDEPVTACPPSLSYRAQKAYRKNKAAIFVTATIIVLLLAGIIGSTWQAVRATNAKRAAALDRDAAIAAEKVAIDKSNEATAAVGKLSVAQEGQRKAQYIFDMEIIPTAWDAGRIDTIQQMLGRHGDDLRHFEWNYWNRQLHSERRSLSLGGKGNPVDRSSVALHWMLNESGTRAVALRDDSDHQVLAASTPFRLFVEFYDTVENKLLGRRSLKDVPTRLGFGFMTPCLSSDGNRFALGVMGGTPRPRLQEIVVVDLAEEKPICRLPVGSESVRNIDLSPDGKYLLMEAADAPADGQAAKLQLRVHDVDQGKELWRAAIIESRRLALGTGRSLYFSQDGLRMAWLTPDAEHATNTKIAVWETATGRELMSLPNPGSGRQSLVLSPDGKRLAVAWCPGPPRRDRPFVRPDWEATVTVADVQSKENLLTQKLQLRSPNSQAPDVQFSPDGSILCMANEIAFRGLLELHAWNVTTGKPIREMECQLKPGRDSTIRFSPNGERFATVDGNALIIRGSRGIINAAQTLRGHVAPISEFTWSADGSRLFSVDTRGEFREWDATPSRKTVIQGVEAKSGRAGVYSPFSTDGRYIVGFPSTPTGSDNNQPRVWEVDGGRSHALPLRPAPETAKPYSSVMRFSPNCRFVSLVRTTYDLTLNRRRAEAKEGIEFADLTVWDAATHEEVVHVALPPGAEAVEISSDGRSAVLLMTANGLMGIDLPSGKQRWARPDRGPSSSFNGFIRMSPDSRRILCSQRDIRQNHGEFPAKITYWVLDAATGADVRAFDMGENTLRHCVWSPDSRRIAFGSTRRGMTTPGPNAIVQIRDVSTGEMVMQVVGEAVEAPILTRTNYLAFSPDGRRIAAKVDDSRNPAGVSSVIDMWDAETGVKLLSLATTRPLPISSDAIGFTADGHRLISASFVSNTFRAGGERIPGTARLRIFDATPRAELNNP